MSEKQAREEICPFSAPAFFGIFRRKTRRQAEQAERGWSYAEYNTYANCKDGVYYPVSSAVHYRDQLSRDLFRLAFQYDLAFGILVLTLGVISMVHPVNTWSYTCIAFGICVLADSLFKVQISLDARVFGIRSWWMILVLAAVAGTFGVLLVFRPSTSSNMMAILIGVSLLADGIMNLATVLSSVKIISHQVSDRAIDADYYEE